MHTHVPIADYVSVQRVYDHLSSVVSVVVVWCSSDIVEIHDTMYHERVGCPYTHQHPHCFILMMPYDTHARIHTTYHPGNWAIKLDNGDNIVLPEHVYRTYLDPEYRYILGPYYNRFFDVYAVTFHQEPHAPFSIILQSPMYRLTSSFKND